MISIHQLRLTIVRLYIGHIQRLYPNKEDGADNLLLVLKIYKWHLIRSANARPATFEWLTTLTTGVREAELILLDLFENEPAKMTGWYAGCNPANEGHRLANLLCELILEMTKEIVANESLHPEFKHVFDTERAQYRQMLNEAREAEALE